MSVSPGVVCDVWVRFHGTQIALLRSERRFSQMERKRSARICVDLRSMLTRLRLRPIG
jgi:hypothetical protein